MIALQRPEILVFLLFAIYPLRNLLQASTYGRIVSITRFLAVALLVVAASGPELTMQQQRLLTPQATVLQDRTGSMQVMDDSKLQLQGVDIERKVAASGNTSAVAQNMAQYIETDQAYIIRSDFQGDGWSQLAETADRKNATLYAYRSGTIPEASVDIQGPESTVPGAETRFTVKVRGTRQDVPVEIYLDGEMIRSTTEEQVEISRVFQERGRHTIRAEIDSDDRISSNNQYYKTFSVNKKPEILVLGSEGTLESQLDTYFSIENVDQLPENLSSYYAVIAKKQFPEDRMSEYVSEGNGLVYTGDYGSSNILPVNPSADASENQDSRIIVAIDISQSQSQNIPQTQQLAYSLAEYLPDNVKMGVVAYSENAYQVMEPATLAYNRDEIKNKISSLDTEVLSYHHKGLEGARKMADGEGNIIMMTDGRFSTGAELSEDQVRRRTLNTAGMIDSKLILVGVGDNVNSDFLRQVATQASGEFIQSNDLSSLSLRLDAGGGAGTISRAAVWDSNHYITQGMRLDSRPALYDSVSLKPGARTLVGSRGGDPVLTTWRYGLGRVAAYTADNTDLEAVMGSDPILGVRTVNWASGDSQRKLDDWLKVEDEGTPVRIESSNPVDGFTRKGKDLYVKELEASSRGFNQYQGITYASNVDREFVEIGYSDSMNSTVERTGGKVFTQGDASGLEEEIVNHSEEKINRQSSAAPYLLGVAMLMLLGEIGYRKLKGKR